MRSGRVVATFVLLVPVAFVVYLASWTGWLVTDGGYDRHSADANPATGLFSWVPLSLQSLWNDHVTMYNAASQITSSHTYASPAWQWPLLHPPDRHVLPPRRVRRAPDAQRRTAARR